MYEESCCCPTGQVLLDVEGEDFPSIAEDIVEALITSGQLPPEQREPVLRILLKKHKHSNDITLWEKLKKSAVDPGECVWGCEWCVCSVWAQLCVLCDCVCGRHAGIYVLPSESDKICNSSSYTVNVRTA